MAVVLVADVPGMTSELYRQAIEQVRAQLEAAPGFVAHAGTPTPQGFRVTEIWESRTTARGSCRAPSCRWPDGSDSSRSNRS